MIDYAQLLLLGAISGFTIFIGLPIAVAEMSQRKKAFLNAIAIGILLFILVDVFGHAWDSVTGTVTSSALSLGSSLPVLAMFAGIAVGLLGLGFYEWRYMRATAHGEGKLESGMAGKEAITGRYRLALLIAIGIGAHNLSEGLAIGQSYAAGTVSLALLLIIGFAMHNATEGFGISGPLLGSSEKPRWSFLIKLGLIGGGPTFLGTVLGSLFVSQLTYVFFLAFAGGALIFVILMMYNVARRESKNSILISGIFIGLLLGFLTDLVLTIAGA